MVNACAGNAKAQMANSQNGNRMSMRVKSPNEKGNPAAAKNL
jgi:hypothetical protein